MPTTNTPPGHAREQAEQDRKNWSALVHAQMETHHITSAAELARRLDRPNITRSDTGRWLRAESGPAPASALRFAELFNLPVLETLRTAGHREIADTLDRLLGETGPGVREALTARAREITRGTPEKAARAIIDSVLTGADDLLLAAEAKADKARGNKETRNAS